MRGTYEWRSGRPRRLAGRRASGSRGPACALTGLLAGRRSPMVWRGHPVSRARPGRDRLPRIWGRTSIRPETKPRLCELGDSATGLGAELVNLSAQLVQASLEERPRGVGCRTLKQCTRLHITLEIAMLPTAVMETCSARVSP